MAGIVTNFSNSSTVGEAMEGFKEGYKVYSEAPYTDEYKTQVYVDHTLVARLSKVLI